MRLSKKAKLNFSLKYFLNESTSQEVNQLVFWSNSTLQPSKRCKFWDLLHHFESNLQETLSNMFKLIVEDRNTRDITTVQLR